MAGLHTLQRPKGIKRPYRRVGRGQSSTRGKTSGRGGKGQTARAGAKIRPEWRDIIKRLPKLRGWGKNRRRGVVATRPRPEIIVLSRVEKAFETGGEVTPRTLFEKGLVRGKYNARRIKIIGDAALSKKLLLKDVAVSGGVRNAVEKAGGSVV